ncbi:hypothetical protein ELH78_03740 [Rhizobium leguminosarum]|nr:hypothetical protein ELH78_03740 [Rhizobium leguminosarum]
MGRTFKPLVISPPVGEMPGRAEGGATRHALRRHSFFGGLEEGAAACSGTVWAVESAAPSPGPSLWAQGVRNCNRFTGSIAAACGGTVAHPPAIPSSSASSAFK